MTAPAPRGRAVKRPATRAGGRASAAGGREGEGEPALLLAERHRRIRRQLEERGSVHVADLARRMGVSEETIRRDLRALAAEGTAAIVHGGAILRRLTASGEAAIPPVERRQHVEQGPKSAIGARAAACVQDGQVVILDAGTTTLAVAQALRPEHHLTVVTNSLVIAQVAAALPHATTYVVGGKLVPGSLSMIGPKARRDLATVRADWAFLGAAAIDVEGGFTSADPYEAEAKRAMIRAARRVAIVADHTKCGSRRFASFADAGDIHCMFTTAGIPSPVRRWLEAAGVEVVVCDAARPSATRSA